MPGNFLDLYSPRDKENERRSVIFWVILTGLFVVVPYGLAHNATPKSSTTSSAVDQTFTKLLHYSFFANDLQKSVLFYTQVLQFRYMRNKTQDFFQDAQKKVIKTRQQSAFFSFDREDMRDLAALEIVTDFDANFKPMSLTSPGVVIGLSVPHLETEVKRIRNVHDWNVSWADGEKFAIVNDPEGNTIEIWQDGEWLEGVKPNVQLSLAKQTADKREFIARRSIIYFALPTSSAVDAATAFNKRFGTRTWLSANIANVRDKYAQLLDDGHFNAVTGVSYVDPIGNPAALVLFRQRASGPSSDDLKKALTSADSNFRYLSIIVNETKALEDGTDIPNDETFEHKPNVSAIIRPAEGALAGYSFLVYQGAKFYEDQRYDQTQYPCNVHGGCFPEQVRGPGPITSFVVHAVNHSASKFFYTEVLQMYLLRKVVHKDTVAYHYGYATEGRWSGNATTIQVIEDANGPAKKAAAAAAGDAAGGKSCSCPRKTQATIVISIFSSLIREVQRIRNFELSPKPYFNDTEGFLSLLDPDGNHFNIIQDSDYRAELQAYNKTFDRKFGSSNRHIVYAKVRVTNLRASLKFFTRGFGLHILRASRYEVAALAHGGSERVTRDFTIPAVLPGAAEPERDFAVLGSSPYEGADNSSVIILVKDANANVWSSTKRPLEFSMITHGPFQDTIQTIRDRGLGKNVYNTRAAEIDSLDKTHAVMTVTTTLPAEPPARETAASTTFVSRLDREWRFWKDVKEAYKIHPATINVDFTATFPEPNSNRGVHRIISTTLNVNDIDKQLKFYTEVLAMKYLRYDDSRRPFTASYYVGYQKEESLLKNDTQPTPSILFGWGATSIELRRDWVNASKFKSTVVPGVTSLTIAYQSNNFAAEVKRIRDLNIQVTYNDKTDAFAQFADPEGNVIQLWDDAAYIRQVLKVWPHANRERMSNARRIVSVNLHVLDTRASVDFYKRAYNMQVVRAANNNRTVWVGFNLENAHGAVLKLEEQFGNSEPFEKGPEYHFAGFALAVSGRSFYQAVQLDIIDSRLSGDNSSVVCFKVDDSWNVKNNRVTMADPDGYYHALVDYTTYLDTVAAAHGKKKPKAH